MKLFFLATFLLSFGLGSAAFADECPNLSHQFKIGLNDVKVKQDGCESWTRYFYFEGEPVGAPSKIIFSEKWSVTEIDDEHEKTVQRHRWFWSRDKKTIVHDSDFESFYKKTEVKNFNALTESFSLEGAFIRRKGIRITRNEKSDGSVEISSKPIDEKYSR